MILGIDPGLDGGIAALDELSGSIVTFCRMPTVKVGKNKRDLDETELRRALDVDCHAFLEQQRALAGGPPCPACRRRRGQGVTSAFRTGDLFGVLRGVLIGLGVPFTVVSPQTWQAAMFEGIPKADRKGRSKEIARQIAGRLWPGEPFLATARSRKPHEGIIDACLIAEHGRRKIRT